MARFTLHHRTFRRWLLSGAAIGAVAVLAIFDVQAQGDNQLQLFVAVSDANGAPVTDLKPDDISMTESGMPGKVVTLERFNRPVKLTVILDNGPDSERLVEHYRTGMTATVDALPADMEVALFTTAPAPSQKVKSLIDRGELKKAFARLGRDDEGARFTDALIEYAQRIEKDVKENKLTYTPVVLMVSAIGSDPTNYRGFTEVEKAIVTVQTAGGRAMVAVTTSRLNDNQARQDLTIGRQGTIGAKLAKVTRGDFQPLPDPKSLVTVLPEWGKQIAATHTKQTTQYRLVLQRPAGVSGPINGQNLDLRVTRPGVKPAVSVDGRF